MEYDLQEIFRKYASSSYVNPADMFSKEDYETYEAYGDDSPIELLAKIITNKDEDPIDRFYSLVKQGMISKKIRLIRILVEQPFWRKFATIERITEIIKLGDNKHKQIIIDGVPLDILYKLVEMSEQDPSLRKTLIDIAESGSSRLYSVLKEKEIDVTLTPEVIGNAFISDHPSVAEHMIKEGKPISKYSIENAISSVSNGILNHLISRAPEIFDEGELLAIIQKYYFNKLEGNLEKVGKLLSVIEMIAMFIPGLITDRVKTKVLYLNLPELEPYIGTIHVKLDKSSIVSGLEYGSPTLLNRIKSEDITEDILLYSLQYYHTNALKRIYALTKGHPPGNDLALNFYLKYIARHLTRFSDTRKYYVNQCLERLVFFLKLGAEVQQDTIAIAIDKNFDEAVPLFLTKTNVIYKEDYDRMEDGPFKIIASMYIDI